MKLEVACWEFKGDAEKVINKGLDYFGFMKGIFGDVYFSDRKVSVPEKNLINVIEPYSRNYMNVHNAKAILEENPANKDERLVILTSNDLGVTGEVLSGPRAVSGMAHPQTGGTVYTPTEGYDHLQKTNEKFREYTLVLEDCLKGEYQNCKIKKWVEDILGRIKKVYNERKIDEDEYLRYQMESIIQFEISFKKMEQTKNLPEELNKEWASINRLLWILLDATRRVFSTNAGIFRGDVGFVHELLHTFGIEHCPSKTCLMFEHYPFQDTVEATKREDENFGVSKVGRVGLCEKHGDEVFRLIMGNGSKNKELGR